MLCRAGFDLGGVPLVVCDKVCFRPCVSLSPFVGTTSWSEGTLSESVHHLLRSYTSIMGCGQDGHATLPSSFDRPWTMVRVCTIVYASAHPFYLRLWDSEHNAGIRLSIGAF